MDPPSLPSVTIQSQNINHLFYPKSMPNSTKGNIRLEKEDPLQEERDQIKKSCERELKSSDQKRKRQDTWEEFKRESEMESPEKKFGRWYQIGLY